MRFLAILLLALGASAADVTTPLPLVTPVLPLNSNINSNLNQESFGNNNNLPLSTIAPLPINSNNLPLNSNVAGPFLAPSNVMYPQNFQPLSIAHQHLPLTQPLLKNPAGQWIHPAVPGYPVFVPVVMPAVSQPILPLNPTYGNLVQQPNLISTNMGQPINFEHGMPIIGNNFNNLGARAGPQFGFSHELSSNVGPAGGTPLSLVPRRYPATTTSTLGGTFSTMNSNTRSYYPYRNQGTYYTGGQGNYYQGGGYNTYPGYSTYPGYPYQGVYPGYQGYPYQGYGTYPGYGTYAPIASVYPSTSVASGTFIDPIVSSIVTPIAQNVQNN